MDTDRKPLVNELELEDAPLQRLQSSGLSFAISLIVHLSLFLFLSLYLFNANENGLISLQLESVDEVGNIEEFSAIIEFDAAQEAEAVELDAESLTEDSEEVIDLPEHFEADLTNMAEFSLEDIEEEPLPLGEMLIGEDEGGGKGSGDNGKASANGSGRSGGFFGVETTGDRIVYLIDMSPSMQKGYGQRRFERAVEEVLYSVGDLAPDQEFLVILFCFRMYAMDIDGVGKYCKATDENKVALRRWLYSAPLAAGTDPREAIVAALRMHPSCCFLLSDGEFNGQRYNNPPFRKRQSAITLARLHNKNECPINTIGLEDRANQKALTKIAEQSGGKYKFVPAIRDQ